MPSDVVPDVAVPDKDEVSDDELGFQTTEVAVSSETRVEQVVEGVCDDTVSMPGRKRKISDEVEILNEVSTPPKKVRDEVTHDHPYGVSKSPRRLKRQIDDLLNTNQCLKKKLRKSQQKARRLKRKVDTLASVVDELKANNLVSGGCAELLEATFSAVPRELMKGW